MTYKSVGRAVHARGDSIQILTEQDASLLVGLNQKGLGDWSRLSIYAAEGIEGHFADLLKNSPDNGYYYYGYFQGETLIGYIEWRLMENSQWFLNNMDVAAESQGAGIGRKLIEHGLDVAKQLGAQTVALDIYRSNTAVFAWYETFGLRRKSEVYIYEFIPDPLPGQAIYRIANMPEAAVLYGKRGYTRLVFADQQAVVGVPNLHYYVVHEREHTTDRALAGAVLQAFPGRRGLYLSAREITSPELLFIECSVRMEMACLKDRLV